MRIPLSISKELECKPKIYLYGYALVDLGQLSIDCTSLPTVSQYTATLPSAYINSDTRIYLSLSDLNMPLNSPNLTLLPTVSGMSPSSLTVQIVRDSSTAILRLGISYLLIRWDDEFWKGNYDNLIVTQVDYAQPISSGNYGFTYPLDHPIINRGWMNSYCFLTGFSIISSSGLSSLSFSMYPHVNGDGPLGVVGQFFPSDGDGALVKMSLIVLTETYGGDQWNAISYYSSVYYLDTNGTNGRNNYLDSDLLTFNIFGGLY
jgi:hypothetical protein